MEKAARKRPLGKIWLADSSASINWIRFQGYYLSSRSESTPRLYSILYTEEYTKTMG